MVWIWVFVAVLSVGLVVAILRAGSEERADPSRFGPFMPASVDGFDLVWDEATGEKVWRCPECHKQRQDGHEFLCPRLR